MSEVRDFERGKEIRGLALRLFSFAKNEGMAHVEVIKEYPETKVKFELSAGVRWVIEISKWLEPTEETKFGRWQAIFNGPADWLSGEGVA